MNNRRLLGALEIFMRLSNKLKMQRYNALKLSGINCHAKEMKILLTKGTLVLYDRVRKKEMASEQVNAGNRQMAQ